MSSPGAIAFYLFVAIRESVAALFNIISRVICVTTALCDFPPRRMNSAIFPPPNIPSAPFPFSVVVIRGPVAVLSNIVCIFCVTPTPAGIEDLLTKVVSALSPQSYLKPPGHVQPPASERCSHSVCDFPSVDYCSNGVILPNGPKWRYFTKIPLVVSLPFPPTVC